MRKSVVGFVAVACMLAVSVLAQNKVVFDNQAGEPALVKLIGPTQTEVGVPNGAKVGTDAAAGRYVIKVRYGTPGNYHYSKGEEFTVTETTTARSETTITLHKVVAGNYDSRPISEKEFAAAADSRRKGSVGDAAAKANAPKWASLVLDILDEADAARFKQMASLQMNMFGTPATDVLGQNVGVLEKKWSIATIQKKHGKPDKIEMATRDEMGAKIDVQRYTYGPFILETLKDNDAVSWVYAPCGDWANGIRETAGKAVGAAE